ncbi:hypothetical protein [Mycobacterium sp.]|uniref:hypothetical protein n=1 Tax=Mycobacterium sp. TaxID=1785 RepID=UPI003C76D11B
MHLAIAVWSAILLTALDDLGPNTDWPHVTVDMLVTRLEDTFAQFMELMTAMRGAGLAAMPGS